eukprot:TRINITY_DN2594_c0_g1_i1.p1 TRINITY_DN2594_c0_g1~~TRINITY_DN2594_c0_g1_i1.p1  ORF type:complete len:654 (-),score=103.83 TRINITY_DN2594_c0_g1_i1:2006-3847(-)
MDEPALHNDTSPPAPSLASVQQPPPSSSAHQSSSPSPLNSSLQPRDECQPASVLAHPAQPHVDPQREPLPDATGEQHETSERVQTLAVPSQLTDASQPSLPEVAPDLQHDLHAVAQHAVQVKSQPQSEPEHTSTAQQQSQPINPTETQLAEQTAQHAIDLSAATEHAQQAIAEAEHQAPPIPASQELIAAQSESKVVHTADPTAAHPEIQQPSVETHALQKAEAQLDAPNPLSDEHASQLAHPTSFPAATGSTVSVPAPTAVADFAAGKNVDGEPTPMPTEYDSKCQQLPHQSVSIPSRRMVERIKRGSERYHASGDQLKTLIAAFEQNPTPDAATLSYLSEAIGMPMHNLVLWFKNRRARHKRTYLNQPSKGGKRSYVKSGIYSRNKRIKQAHHNPAPTTVPSGGLTLPLSHGLSAISSPLPVSSVALSPGDAKNVAMVAANRDIEDLIKSGAPHPSRMKRPRFSAIPELVGDDNPCQGWTSEECHRRCVAFFERATNSAFPEQSKIVEHISSEFFLSELQSGLTLVSAMQPLETSVGVLDAIMEKLPAEGPRPSSGSKVIMREFLAQIRTGSAEQFALLEGTVVHETETVAESHANVPQTVEPAALSTGEQ